MDEIPKQFFKVLAALYGYYWQNSTTPVAADQPS